MAITDLEVGKGYTLSISYQNYQAMYLGDINGLHYFRTGPVMIEAKDTSVERSNKGIICPKNGLETDIKLLTTLEEVLKVSELLALAEN